MTTDAPPAESEWLTRSRMAAYRARRRLNLDSSEITPQDMEDLIQVAAIAYWQQLRDGRHPAYCFASARNAVQNYFMRQIRGRNPRNPLLPLARCGRRQGLSLLIGHKLWYSVREMERCGETRGNFTGERWEAYSELLFLRARYYEPRTGRFLAKDPWTGSVTLPSTLDGWVYVQNNPLRYVDPTGYIKETQEEQANEQVEYLFSQYGIRVKVDWGWKWRLVWACPPWQKVWDEGVWDLGDLVDFRGGVDRFASAMGGGFRTDIGEGLVIKGAFDRLGPLLSTVAETTRNGRRITFYNYALIEPYGWTFREIVIHELAHVWDFRSGLALEKEFKLATDGGEQPYIPLLPGGPGMMLSLEEDFAWSAAFYLSNRHLDETRLSYLSLKFPCRPRFP